MKQFYQIDDDGYYTGPVVVGDNDPAYDYNIVKEPFPNHLNLPRWTGEMWVEGQTDADLVRILKNGLIQQAKVQAEQEMSEQYPDADNWLVDYTLDYGVGRRPNQDQRMRRVNEIRDKRDRFIAAAKAKTTPSRLRTMAWENEATWA